MASAIDELRERVFHDRNLEEYTLDDLRQMDANDSNRLKFFTEEQLIDPDTNQRLLQTENMLQEIAILRPGLLITNWARENIDSALLEKVWLRQELTPSEISADVSFGEEVQPVSGPQTIEAVVSAFVWGNDPEYYTDPEVLGLAQFVDVNEQIVNGITNPNGRLRAAYNEALLLGAATSFVQTMSFVSKLSQYNEQLGYNIGLRLYSGGEVHHGAAIWGRFGGRVMGTLSVDRHGRFSAGGNIVFERNEFSWEPDTNNLVENLGLAVIGSKPVVRPGHLSNLIVVCSIIHTLSTRPKTFVCGVRETTRMVSIHLQIEMHFSG